MGALGVKVLIQARESSQHALGTGGPAFDPICLLGALLLVMSVLSLIM